MKKRNIRTISAAIILALFLAVSLVMDVAYAEIPLVPSELFEATLGALNGYLSNGSSTVYDITSIRDQLWDLQGSSEYGLPFYLYADTLTAIEELDFRRSSTNLIQLTNENIYGDFNSYLATDEFKTKYPAIRSVSELYQYAKGREAENQLNYSDALQCYTICQRFYDGYSRLVDMMSKTETQEGELPVETPIPPQKLELPVMRSDVPEQKNYFDKSASNYIAPTVFQSKYTRDSITTISFQNRIDIAPEGAWDISVEGNRSVLAWVESNNLVIAGDGGVRAPKNCKLLFAFYTNLKTIKFNGCFDTSDIVDMTGMFEACEKLEDIDVSGFQTENVTSMSWLFSKCKSLVSVDVSGFKTTNVVSMARMFDECTSLRSLDIRNFDTRNVTHMTKMFCNCENLLSIYTGENFVIGETTTQEEMYANCPAGQ